MRLISGSEFYIIYQLCCYVQHGGEKVDLQAFKKSNMSKTVGVAEHVSVRF